MDRSDARATNAYWGRDGIERTILDALAAAGKNTDTLTVDDLAPADQFHSGGKGATERLARMANVLGRTKTPPRLKKLFKDKETQRSELLSQINRVLEGDPALSL